MNMQAMARWLGEPKKVALLLLAAGLAAVAALGLASAASAATFSNTDGPITINSGSALCVGGGGTAPGTGNPYPSVIAVDGLGSSVTDVNVTVSGLSANWPDDIDLLLISPTGQSVILMADSGGDNQFRVSGVNLTFDDAASDPVPDNNALVSESTYRPSRGTGPGAADCDVPASFPGDAPAGPYGTSLSVFNDTDPNGNWQLYVIDDTLFGEGASITSWSLDISSTTAEDTTPPTVTYTTPDGPDPVSRTATVTATFDEDVQNVSPETFILERQITVKKASPKYVRVDATVSLSDDDLTYVLDPVQDLPKGDYRATITTDVTDVADPANALEDNVVWTFKVEK